MRGRTMSTSLALACALVGCGGDDGVTVDASIDAAITASDYDGLWWMTELVVDDAGTARTLRRDGVPQAIRGDVLFTSTGTLTGTVDVRQALLDQGLLASDVFHDVDTVVLEPGRWVLTTGTGEVVVFTVVRDGERVILTHDAADPRDDATSPPRAMTLDRVTPWSSATVGAWDLVSITIGGTTVQGGVCTPTPIPEQWTKLTMEIDVSPRLLFSRVMTMRRYLDSACSQPSGETSSTQLGMGEEIERLGLRMWGRESGRSEFQAFDLAVAGDRLTLTRTACLPSPACLDSAPTEVVIRRRGL